MFADQIRVSGNEQEDEVNLNAKSADLEPCTHAVDAEQSRLEDPDDGLCAEI